MILVSEEHHAGFLLHNTNDRYFNDPNFVVPVRAQTLLLSEYANINVDAGVRQTAEVELFQGHVDQKEIMAKTWLKGKRGIRCGQAGGFLAEYNYRFFFEKDNNMGNEMLNTISYF